VNARQRQQSLVEADFSRPIVLLVEDEVLLRMSVSACLRRRGYTVIEAHSADEACQIMVAGVAPDALFTDISLPGSMDGIALARFARFALPNTKIIIGTAFDRLALDARGVGQHDALLTKPYVYDMIETTLARLLGAFAAKAPR
jgi:CheY-like chemotaxis protein